MIIEIHWDVDVKVEQSDFRVIDTNHLGGMTTY